MTKVDDLENELTGILDEFAGISVDAMEAAQKAAAKAGVKKLKQTSPKRSGEYAKGWKTKTEKTRTGTTTTIYNGDRPGLAHLLEFGHAKVNGGRTRAIPHIKPVEDEVTAIYLEELKKGIENDA